MSQATKGRGTSFNPPNRFERMHIEPLDGDEALIADEAPALETELYVDSSRSILAENDSPDVPFRYSLNPYRGCEHGCVYCLAGDTSIRMADGTLRPLEALRIGDVVYGTFREAGRRGYVGTPVLDHWAIE